MNETSIHLEYIGRNAGQFQKYIIEKEILSNVVADEVCIVYLA